ncbi:MAG: HD domain-containing protein, partial [Bacteroidales bacterium]
KFLIARRLMYWQVYLHKTVLAAELMLLSIFKRLYFLFSQNKIKLPPVLSEFWTHNITFQELNTDVRWLDLFSSLDDSDIWIWIKSWTRAEDKVLSLLSNRFIERKLFKVEIQRQPHNNEKINLYRKRIQNIFNLSEEESEYLVFSDSAENHAYSVNDNKINILLKNGKLIDISDASDILNIEVLSKNVIKYFLCFLPECTI